MVAQGRIAVVAKIDPSYTPVAVNVHGEWLLRAHATHALQ